MQDFDEIIKIQRFVLLEPLRVKCLESNNEVETLKMWELKFGTLKFIERVFDRIKISTNQLDKSALQIVLKLFEENKRLEKKYDTSRVKAYPKRISVQGRSK